MVPPAGSDERLLNMRIEKQDGEVELSGYLGILAKPATAVTPWERDRESVSEVVEVHDPLPLVHVGDKFAPKTMAFDAAEILPVINSVNDGCPWYD